MIFYLINLLTSKNISKKNYVVINRSFLEVSKIIFEILVSRSQKMENH